MLCLDEELPTVESEQTATCQPKKFRMSGMSYFLTFAQCSEKKEDVAKRIEDKWPSDIKGYIVCEEQHKDGTPHLHVFLQFTKRKNFKDSNCFDFLGKQHGSYEVAKSIRGSVTYVTKAGNYIAKGVDVDAIKAKKASRSTEYATMLMEGKSLSEINKIDPGYVMLNKRKLEEYEQWCACEAGKKRKLAWVPPSLDGLTDSNKEIAQWICSNIRQPRKFKAPQLFITGKTNLGKTSLVEWLEKFLSVYHIPHTEDFYDLYSDDHDLVVFDEFKGQKTIQWMNLFLQGAVMNIRKKGSQYMKTKNLPVIILSNYSIGDCYPKARDDGRLDTLLSRLTIVEVDSHIDFYKSHDDLI